MKVRNVMLSPLVVERLKKAMELEKGCPWEIPEYTKPHSIQSPMLMWSGDAWDAARAYFAAVEAIEFAIDKLNAEIVISRNIGSNGTAAQLAETMATLRSALPHAAGCTDVVMPWADRARELEEQEGPYSDYAAWCEWLDKSIEWLPESVKLDIDRMDSIKKSCLYHLFTTACRATVPA